MAALSAAVTRATRDDHLKSHVNPVVGTGAVLYAGALVNIDTATGRAVAASAATARKFCGIAEETKTGDTAGTVRCRVAFGHQALINALTALTTAYVGSDCVISTDNDATTNSAISTAKRVRVGEITEFESGDVWVRLRCYSSATV